MYKSLLKEFREDRRIDGKIGIKANVGEEALEVAEAILSGDKSKVIGEVCDIVVFCENYLSCFDGEAEYRTFENIPFERVIIEGLKFSLKSETGEFGIICRAIDLISFCRSAIETAGYDFDKCMVETCHKILSRTGAYSEEAQKWCKNPNQPKSELYAPDYASCKKGK